ncbi:hypothetical protein MTO96_002514 [Rhipicephalus appendiculatus]
MEIQPRFGPQVNVLFRIDNFPNKSTHLAWPLASTVPPEPEHPEINQNTRAQRRHGKGSNDAMTLCMTMKRTVF